MKLLFISLGVLALAGAGYHQWARHRISTDDAFVDGHVYSITPRVKGFVAEVPVADNQLVKKGDVLLKLDPVDYEVELAQARADLARAQAAFASSSMNVPLELLQTRSRVSGAVAGRVALEKSLEKARDGEEAARQDFKRAEAVLNQAQADFRRYRELLKTKVISQSDMDQSEARYKTALADQGRAEANVNAALKARMAAEAEIDKARADVDLAATGKNVADIKAKEALSAKAAVDLAEARVRQAELNLSYTTIVAPADGHVTKKSVEPGQYASAGQKLMAVVPIAPEEVWITANYKETQLSEVKPGQSVEIDVDTYSGKSLKGHVDSIMAGTGAAFSLFPPENAAGNFVKVVQRIPVKIVLDLKDMKDAPALRLGMSAVPTIFTGN